MEAVNKEYSSENRIFALFEIAWQLGKEAGLSLAHALRTILGQIPYRQR